MTQILLDRQYQSTCHYPPNYKNLGTPMTGLQLIEGTTKSLESSLEDVIVWLNTYCPSPRATFTIKLLPIPVPPLDTDPPAINGMGQYYESCEDGRMLFERHVWLVDRWVRQWRSCPVELYVFLLNTAPVPLPLRVNATDAGLRLKMAVEDELSYSFPWKDA